MNRTLTCIAIALAVIVASAPDQLAWADDPPPSATDLAAAKKAFMEAKVLYDAGKLADAVDKLEESYRLSRNPVLLYNIGHTLDELGQKDKALPFYKKFLTDAPADAVQRKDVTVRVEALEKELTPTPTPTPVPPVAEPKKITLDHQPVESLPPDKPHDVVAVLPEGSVLTATLFYRGSDDGTYTSKPMKWRNKELVARIPNTKLTGTTIQYYLEVRDQAGALVTRSGKSTSPHLVRIDAGAKPRFYADLVDDGEVFTEVKRPDGEDPLHRKPIEPEVPVVSESELRDASARRAKAKWISTGAATALIGTSIITYILAKQQADDLAADSVSCGTPPCRVFDAKYDQKYESLGRRYNTIHQVTFGVGVAAVAVAGYFWYRDLTAKKRGELRVGANHARTPVAIAPALDVGFTGAAMMGRF